MAPAEPLLKRRFGDRWTWTLEVDRVEEDFPVERTWTFEASATPADWVFRALALLLILTLALLNWAERYEPPPASPRLEPVGRQDGCNVATCDTIPGPAPSVVTPDHTHDSTNLVVPPSAGRAAGP